MSNYYPDASPAGVPSPAHVPATGKPSIPFQSAQLQQQTLGPQTLPPNFVSAPTSPPPQTPIPAQPHHQRQPTIASYQSGSEAGATSSQEPLNIIILGASFGGLSCAHHFLDYTIDRLGTSSAVRPYRLIIISPSTHIYWNIGAPRALVKGGLIKHEDTFIPIEPGFVRHRGHDWTIVQGKAIDWDPEDRSVKIECLNLEAQKRCSYLLPKRGSKAFDTNASVSSLPTVQSLPYHALIITTGTSAHSDLLSLHGPHLHTADALNAFHRKVAAAKSIVVCGGGTSGVEVAGQLATLLNYKSHIGPFKTKVPNPKSITLITGSDRCLPGVPNPKVGTIAEKSLLKLGVEIRHNVRVTDAKEWFDQTGATRIDLSDNTQLIADVYIACTGVGPNSAFVPTYLKDDKGYIAMNHKTMRVDAAGDRVYAIGDVASYSYNYVPDVYAAVPVVMHNLLNDLIAHELSVSNPYGGNDDYIEQLVDEEYVQRENDSQLCPISRYGGAGMLLGNVLPKVMVHLLKGHDYRVCKAKGVVVNGGNPYATPIPGNKYSSEAYDDQGYRKRKIGGFGKLSG
ncbi:Oxidoreductase phnG [Fulvia fulva]|uniref:Oxidoreductase phnG n=1 Tax=Passalora fulva TaxID=5499 RepID=A0A9Q8P9Y9_PASFU|nr:Oxidoreductase phnG [Fulvia fulva]KAK4621314.1 Oxidoreductase phnG [Fulvia fulva]KAK4622627.1 Oxidoreductase phnG [Fulvia fulva]UJO18604.1 Oxidoreductase phnG [Fulvia fulva]WPV16158.1 Oxidoreductase phnG [Fulvia fulva]WPV30960.1 Oxidoreductase phnG [Fulvia fulva]